MDKRPEPRVSADIPVRIWGMDAEGRPFFQNAHAGSISDEGAALTGIAHPLKAGDVIGIQHGEHKARFRIVWIVDTGGARKREAGVELLPAQHSPWRGMAKIEMSQPQDSKNRRRYARYKVLFPIEISFPDANRGRMQTHATDIGGRGCYVETLVPLAVGTNVNINFAIDAEKIRTTGTVRTSAPGVGMGLEFTTLDDQVQQRLQQFLERMDTGFAQRDAATQGS